jgi:hypothetical protein
MINTTIGSGASFLEGAPTYSRLQAHEEAKATPTPDSKDRSWLEAQARRFSALLSQSSLRPGLANGRTEEPAAAKTDSSTVSGLAQTLDPTKRSQVDISSQLRAVSVPDPMLHVQAPPVEHFDTSLAELIEQHIRGLMVGAASREPGNQAVRLELSNAVLPETIFSLRRNRDGWQLLATSRSRQSLERLARHTPALVDRFAQASLGSLEVIAQLDLEQG